MLYNQTTKFTDQQTERQKDKRAARQAEHCQRANSHVDKMAAAYTIAGMTAQTDTSVSCSPQELHASMLLLCHVTHMTNISICLGRPCSHTRKGDIVTMMMMSDQV